MAFYLSFAFTLWVFSFATLLKARLSQPLAVLSALILTLVAGLRFQTGYDWWAYQGFFDGVPPLTDLISSPHVFTKSSMEPLFTIFVSATKSFGGNLSAVFLISAAFNVACFLAFTSFFRIPLTTFAAIYFCWLYLPVQMGVLRQSLGLSFLALAVICAVKRRHSYSVLLFLTALGFQFSILMFAPIFLTKATPFLKKYLKWVLIALIAFAVVGADLSKFLLEIAGSIDFEFIRAKLAFYKANQNSGRSLTSIAYLAFNAGVLVYLTPRIGDEKGERILWNCTFLLFLAQCLFPSFPLIWNRVQYFAVPAQIVLWLRTEPKDLKRTLIGHALVLVLSTLVLLKDLMNPLATPFVPYQSILKPNSNNDGLERTKEYYRRQGY